MWAFCDLSPLLARFQNFHFSMGVLRLKYFEIELNFYRWRMSCRTTLSAVFDPLAFRYQSDNEARYIGR